jgi:hypothetical protein
MVSSVLRVLKVSIVRNDETSNAFLLINKQQSDFVFFKRKPDSLLTKCNHFFIFYFLRFSDALGELKMIRETISSANVERRNAESRKRPSSSSTTINDVSMESTSTPSSSKKRRFEDSMFLDPSSDFEDDV